MKCSMLKSKLIVLIVICLALAGCDQVRDKLLNGFDWNSSRIDSANNNESIVNSEVHQKIKQVNKAEDQPNLPQNSPKQISSDVKPPILVTVNPSDRPKVAPETRPNVQNGFKDNDW